MPTQPHPFDREDSPSTEPVVPAAPPDAWIEDDALADVHVSLDRFTREWRERAPSYDGLLRAAKLWVHQLEQREARRNRIDAPTGLS
jgi:hypothetical protein